MGGNVPWVAYGLTLKGQGIADTLFPANRDYWTCRVIGLVCDMPFTV